MNLFATFSCPVHSAMFLDDRRVISSIIETSAMLSNALRYHSRGENKIPERDLNRLSPMIQPNNPVCVWVRTNTGRYDWTLRHLHALLTIYNELMGGKKFVEVKERAVLYDVYRNIIPDGDIRRFHHGARNLSLGLDFTSYSVHDGYQLYLNTRWIAEMREGRLPKWTGRATIPILELRGGTNTRSILNGYLRHAFQYKDRKGKMIL